MHFQNNTSEFSRIVRESKQFQPLVDSGLELAMTGVTSIREIIRIVGDVIT